MRYLCLVYFEPNIFDAFTPAEGAAFTNEAIAYDESLMARGLFVDANALQSTVEARTVRVRDGKMSVTSGPFAETREVLGGYVLVEAPNMDEALKAAAGIPLCRYGSVEVPPRSPDQQDLRRPTMNYILLIYQGDPRGVVSQATIDAYMTEIGAHNEDMKQRHQFVMTAGLGFPDSATCVRQVNGKTQMTDGPFAETKEYLGGLYVIEARDLNDALKQAAALPMARFATIEVRPVTHLDVA